MNRNFVLIFSPQKYHECLGLIVRENKFITWSRGKKNSENYIIDCTAVNWYPFIILTSRQMVSCFAKILEDILQIILKNAKLKNCWPS